MLLGGCISRGLGGIVMNPETRNATFTVEMPFDEAFVHAARTMAALGGNITSQDSKAGTISAVVHNAVNMTVSLNRVSDARTELVVYGSTIPGKVVVGVFTEVEDFQNLYMKGAK
jgi:uncharacterized protein (AIM24 family)